MNTKSANRAYLDALWRAYVNADPDLHRLEQRKQAIAHRRAWKEHARRVRAEAGREILTTLAIATARAVICIAAAAVFMLLILA